MTCGSRNEIDEKNDGIYDKIKINTNVIKNQNIDQKYNNKQK